ncbi:uncharacterized protein [Diadema antillarum]|uniref:uncharacterized protein n=1 Tax=Diadema antillarum TaxID=105358 RepID=UPI003A884A26
MRRKQPNPRRRRRRNYSSQSFERALALVKKGVSVMKAAFKCGVPRITLLDRVNGRTQSSNLSTKHTILTHADEAALVDHLKKLASYGYGLTRTQVIHLATDMADSLGRRPIEMKGRLLSKKWFQLFMRRWPSLNLTSPRRLEMNRAKATTKEVLKNYFGELQRTMQKYDLLDKPQNIYNIDETNFNADHKPPQVVSDRGEKRSNSITSHRIGTTTILACGSAIGRALPPFYIFKGKRKISDLMNGALPGSQMCMTESGWSNGDVFRNYLEQHFLPSLPPRRVNEHVMILYNGHTSHISIPVLEFARAHRIVLFVLPAHTSHVLQPLDVACFAPLKRAYSTECAKFMQTHPGEMVTRYDIARLSSSAYLRAMGPENLKSAFRKSGVWPLNPKAVGMEEATRPSLLVTPTRKEASAPQHQVGPMGDARQTTQQTSAESFLSSKTPSPPQQQAEKGTQRRVTVHFRPSGVCVSEDRIFLKICKAKNKGKERPTQKKTCPTDQPGPSGISTKSTRRLFSDPSVTDSEDMEEDDNPCCVCGRNTPPHPSRDHLEFYSWVACDESGCSHWVHQKYCTASNKMYGKNDTYKCPCH